MHPSVRCLFFPFLGCCQKCPEERLACLHVLVAGATTTARSTLSALVRSWGWTVAAEAKDGYEAVRLARELYPDVLLVDASVSGRQMSTLFELMTGSGSLVVRLIDRPQEHAELGGIAVLKGVPSERIRKVILESLGERHVGPGQEQAGPERSR